MIMTMSDNKLHDIFGASLTGLKEGFIKGFQYKLYVTSRKIFYKATSSLETLNNLSIRLVLL